MAIRADALVAIFDLAPIELGDGPESLKFRVEVFRLGSKRVFYAKLYRKETLRVRATFPVIGGKARGFLADHEILVADDSLGLMDFRSRTRKGVVDKVSRKVAEVLSSGGKRKRR
jgi:hypothetical protein